MKATISLILFSFLGLSFPDTDFILFPVLSHRSIITHSIIVPFFIYRYLKKKKGFNNQYIDLVYSGFLVGIGIHLIADLFPRAYMGYALIKLPFHISIGVVPTILWILLNIFFAFKIALDKARLDLNKKINKTLYFISLTIITLIYLASEYEPVTKIAFFLFTVVIAWIYLKKVKPKIEINRINKDHKSKKYEEKEVKKEKQSGLTFFLTTVMVLVIFGGGILLISNHYNDGSLTFDQQKESFRAKNLYKDEANLCETQIRKRYPKAKFTKVMVSNYYAPQDKLSYEKILNMWADHKVLMINIPWGKIDCKIKVNSDQSIEFLELSKKY